MNRSALKSYLLKGLVSLGLILLLLRLVNTRELAAIPSRIHWFFLFGYFALNLIDRLIMAYKWKILLEAKQVPSSWGRLIIVYFQGTFWGNLFPSSLGGDVVRAYELSRNTTLAADVISSIIMERFIGFLSAALMALLVVPFFFFYAPDFPRVLLWFLLLFLTGGILLLLFLIRGTVPPSLQGLLSRLPLAAKLSQVTASFVLYRRHPRALLRFFLWSFGEQILPVLTLYLLARSLGWPIPFFYLLLIIPMAQFFARIPVSMSGFGVQEGLLIALFSFFHLSSTQAFALGFASNLGNLVIGLPGAFFYLKGRPQTPPAPLSPLQTPPATEAESEEDPKRAKRSEGETL